MARRDSRIARSKNDAISRLNIDKEISKLMECEPDVRGANYEDWQDKMIIKYYTVRSFSSIARVMNALSDKLGLPHHSSNAVRMRAGKLKIAGRITKDHPNTRIKYSV